MPTTAPDWNVLACPLDGLALSHTNNSWHCSAGHCFDVSRQGYVNLLPVQNKRSRDPGDSKDMVTARHEFLQAGFYQPIAELLQRAVLSDASAEQPLRCLDAGCGEGYYLRQLQQSGHAMSLTGLDISKWAVQSAARLQRSACWLVGSNARLPLLSASMDRVLCLFGFPVYPEFARVLRPGGELLQLDPGPEHLRELRQVIYPSLKPAKPARSDAPPGFAVIDRDSLCYRIELNTPALIQQLLVMTPHLYRATAEGRARAAALSAIELTVQVQLQRLRRTE